MNKILYADDLILMSESTEKIMVNGLKCEVLQSKVDPYAKYDKRAIENLVVCTKCSKWVHNRCVKIKRVTTTLAEGLVCWQCFETIEKPDKKI